MKNNTEAEKWHPSNDVKAFHAEYPEEGFNWLEFAESYHQHMKEKELSELTDEVIEGMADKVFNRGGMSVMRKIGFEWGVKFLRDHLKQKKCQ